MTKQEAERLVPIMLSVDGNCSVCVRGVFCRVITAFPEHNWVALALQSPDFKNLHETEEDFRESISFGLEERETEERMAEK